MLRKRVNPTPDAVQQIGGLLIVFFRRCEVVPEERLELS
jgi:hypothetical protein